MEINEIFKKVKEIILKNDNLKKKIEDTQITLNTNLKNDLGFDSLDLIELTVLCSIDFNIIFSDQEEEKIRTIKDVCILIKEKII